MNFSLYMMLFVVLGTLIFGLAFPFMIAFLGLLLVVFAALWIFRLLSGGSGFTVYTSRSYDRARRAEETEDEPPRRRVFSAEQTPPRRSHDRRAPYINVAADDEEMAEATEIVELPATALRKDDAEETD